METSTNWYVAAADHDAQISVIESKFERMKKEPEYFHLFVRLIHSLVRTDPEKRDPEEAKRVIKQLELLDV